MITTLCGMLLFLCVSLLLGIRKQAATISNLKDQLFNHKIRYDLESHSGNISEDYSMEVPPPIPRMLQ
jgi:hypothetical protein